MSRHEVKLIRQLSAVRSRWLLRDAVLSLAQMLGAVLGVFLVFGCLDYHFRFPGWLRAIELTALFTWTGLVIGRLAVPLWRQRRDAHATALRVESVYRQFAGRLVSWVQFRSDPSVAVGQGEQPSAELIRAMCERVERKAADLPLGRAVDLKPLRRPLAGAAAALALTCLLATSRPELVRIWLTRTIHPTRTIAWPRRTYIAELADRYRVRRGDSLCLTGRVTGRVPAAGRLQWWVLRGGEHWSEPLRRSGSFKIAADGRFTTTLGPLLEPTVTRVSAGDSRTNDIRIDVVTPPALAAIEAVYHYPPFTRRQPRRVSAGDVRAPVGTRVELTLTADRPIQHMDLSFVGKHARPVQPVRLISKTQGLVSFTVRSRALYSVRVVDAYGFAANEPATFLIEPIENEHASVALERPGPEHVVTPGARVCEWTSRPKMISESPPQAFAGRSIAPPNRGRRRHHPHARSYRLHHPQPGCGSVLSGTLPRRLYNPANN